MNHEYVIVLTTLPADADGPAFARGIVESYLAACVNLLPPMVSVYRRPRPAANLKYVTHHGFGVFAFIGKNGLPASRDALALVVVLGACAYVIVRVWRIEHRY